MTPTESAPGQAPAKRSAEFFAAVRARGLLNAMLDGPALAYERANPGWRARWEYFPAGPGADNTMVVYREGVGFKLVDAAELGEKTASEQADGLVRRGDLVLMAGPEDLVNELELEDAKRAYDDYKLPEAAYREHVESIRVKRKDGTEEKGRPFGSITRTTETLGPTQGLRSEGG